MGTPSRSRGTPGFETTPCTRSCLRGSLQARTRARRSHDAIDETSARRCAARAAHVVSAGVARVGIATPGIHQAGVPALEVRVASAAVRASLFFIAAVHVDARLARGRAHVVLQHARAGRRVPTSIRARTRITTVRCTPVVRDAPIGTGVARTKASGACFENHQPADCHDH